MAFFYCGTDPEFAIKDKEGNPVPAWKIFPDKHNKINVDLRKREKGYGGEILPGYNVTAFHDGYAVEINVPASECRGNLAGYMLVALQGVMKKLPEGHTLCSLPTVKINLNDMIDAPEDCQIFGCDPSWNAYTGEYSGVALEAATHPERYAGGHMHISVPNTYQKIKTDPSNWIFDKQEVPLFVKMLDRYVGLPLTVWFAKPETFKRRRYYGKAGEFRFQEYPNQMTGVEYRTPGPELWNSPVVASFAFGVMRYVANNFNDLKSTWDASLEQPIRDAINIGEGMEDLVKKSYIQLSGSENKLEWFERTILRDKPFQTLAQEFDANTGVGHMGWDWYQTLVDRGRPYVMTSKSYNGGMGAAPVYAAPVVERVV